MSDRQSKRALSNIIAAIDNINKDKSITDLFLEDLNASIEKTDYDNQKEPSKTYKPSSMNCKRACFYTLTGVPINKRVKNSTLCGICESGTDRHVRIQQSLEDMKNNGYDLEYIDVETYIKDHKLEDKLKVVEKLGMETKLYMPSLNMSFMTDGIIKYRDKYYIFEFKTEIPNKFLQRKFVDEAHLSQGTAYSCAFGLDDVIFLYENRATCERKAYLLHVTDEMRKDRIYDFIDSCNDYVDKNVVPPMPFGEVLKKCKYCDYQALCAKHGIGEKPLGEPLNE